MSVPPPLLTSNFTPVRSNHPSSRSISRICGDADIVGLIKRETATVLSIAHLTDWSAELIAHKVNEYLDVSISPETVWDTYKSWEDVRTENRLDGLARVEDKETSKAMLSILRQLGIEPNFDARPLSHTPRPVTVPFAHVWYPLDTHLFADFTEESRKGCIKALTWRKENTDLSKPVAYEEIVLDKLGRHATRIMKSLMQRWIDDMTKAIARLPFTKAIELGLENWDLIDRYVDAFKKEWEAEFGMMDDDDEMFWVPIATDPTFIHIRSTGAAAKFFFCLMLLTRLQALEERRKCWRAIQCFIEVPLEDLPADVKNCYICQEPFGVPNDEGEMEMPIRVVACCGNYFGANCLRKWYGEYENSRCPLCKWTVSAEFLEKLLFEDHDSESDFDNPQEDLASVGSIRYPTPSNDDDMEQSEALVDDGLEEGPTMLDEEDDLEDGEIKE